MEQLEILISSGRIVDLMLLVVVIEVIALILYWRFTGKGVQPLRLIMNVGAGGSLMLALRASLVGASTLVLAACLLASLGFHVADVALRWQNSR